MAGVKQRVYQAPKLRKKIRPVTKSKTGLQQEAIELANITEMPLAQIESQILQEVFSDVAEVTDQATRRAFYPGSEGQLPDDDYYDFSEYEEENPLTDPDRRFHRWPSWDKNDFEAEDSEIEIEPRADIIIDEFGNVEIPLEEILSRYCGYSAEKRLSYSPFIRRIRIKAQLLREIGEALLDKLKQIILNDETDLSKIKLVPLTQKELMHPLGLKKEIRSRLTNHYIKTPYWGVLHLSFFFLGDIWQEIISEVKTLLAKEDLSRPYKTNVIWNMVKARVSRQYKDNRQFKNVLRKAGIPLETSRREIYKCTKKWHEKKNPRSIKISGVPKIRRDLMKDHLLFSTNHTRQCCEPQYTLFVEERIIAILQSLEVKILKK